MLKYVRQNCFYSEFSKVIQITLSKYFGSSVNGPADLCHRSALKVEFTIGGATSDNQTVLLLSLYLNFVVALYFNARVHAMREMGGLSG